MFASKESESFMSSEVNQSQKDAGRFLCFSLGHEKFAMPLSDVKEVIGHVSTTAVPNSLPHFVGIMNLRGQVYSVMDLRIKMKIGKPEKTAETTIIIMDFEDLSFGVVVDSVDCVSTFERQDVSEPPSNEFGIKSDFITGVARVEKSLILIINLQAMFNVKDRKTTAHQKAA
jgi:purine-binding chemotaxis protein CheW